MDILDIQESNLINKLKYKFCPECGCTQLKIIIQTSENHLYCANCKQELFIDVDYTDCIRSNLSKFQAQQIKIENLKEDVKHYESLLESDIENTLEMANNFIDGLLKACGKDEYRNKYIDEVEASLLIEEIEQERNEYIKKNEELEQQNAFECGVVTELQNKITELETTNKELIEKASRRRIAMELNDKVEKYEQLLNTMLTDLKNPTIGYVMTYETANYLIDQIEKALGDEDAR